MTECLLPALFFLQKYAFHLKEGMSGNVASYLGFSKVGIAGI
jgi:hypothetical protein